MNFKLTILIIAAILFSSIAAFSQEQKRETYKNELGIDVANILTFLSKKNESYLINYKRNLKGRHYLRTGLNGEWSSKNKKDGYRAIGVKVGYEMCYPVAYDRWKLHWGLDATFRYSSTNFLPSSSIRYGIGPIIGFAFFISKHFSVSTELGANFFYTDFRNPESYDPRDNDNVWDITIGSVGMVVVSYHF